MPNEFWDVVKGNGPCNKQRIKARKKAYDDGAWVREAAMAYAEKRSMRKEKKIKVAACSQRLLKIGYGGRRPPSTQNY
jgi:hypothetical protein